QGEPTLGHASLGPKVHGLALAHEARIVNNKVTIISNEQVYYPDRAVIPSCALGQRLPLISILKVLIVFESNGFRPAFNSLTQVSSFLVNPSISSSVPSLLLLLIKLK